MCASSDISSIQHTNAKIGNSIISHNIRKIIMKETSNKFNYTRLIKSNLEYVKNISKNLFLENHFLI